MGDEARAIRKELEPVLFWYQSDEEKPRPTAEIVRDVVADLQMDRDQVLSVQKLAQGVKSLCEDGHPFSALNFANDILRIIRSAPTPESGEGRDHG